MHLGETLNTILFVIIKHIILINLKSKYYPKRYFSKHTTGKFQSILRSPAFCTFFESKSFM